MKPFEIRDIAWSRLEKTSVVWLIAATTMHLPYRWHSDVMLLIKKVLRKRFGRSLLHAGYNSLQTISPAYKDTTTTGADRSKREGELGL